MGLSTHAAALAGVRQYKQYMSDLALVGTDAGGFQTCA
jgi:hypothetical protein